MDMVDYFERKRADIIINGTPIDTKKIIECYLRNKPTKLITRINKGDNIFIQFHCPNCLDDKGAWNREYIDTLISEQHTEYCFKCGQHLLWPTSKEELENEIGES